MNSEQIITKLKNGYQLYHSTFKQEYSVSNHGRDRTVISKETFDSVTQDPRVYPKEKNIWLFHEGYPEFKINGSVSDKELDLFIENMKHKLAPINSLFAWSNANPGLINRLNDRLDSHFDKSTKQV